MKILKHKKLVADLDDKMEYPIHIRILKQALNHGLVSKKTHAVIKFSQSVWLIPYIEMNADLRRKAKNNSEKDFLS